MHRQANTPSRASSSALLPTMIGADTVAGMPS